MHLKKTATQKKLQRKKKHAAQKEASKAFKDGLLLLMCVDLGHLFAGVAHHDCLL